MEELYWTQRTVKFMPLYRLDILGLRYQKKKLFLEMQTFLAQSSGEEALVKILVLGSKLEIRLTAIIAQN